MYKNRVEKVFSLGGVELFTVIVIFFCLMLTILFQNWLIVSSNFLLLIVSLNQLEKKMKGNDLGNSDI